LQDDIQHSIDKEAKEAFDTASTEQGKVQAALKRLEADLQKTEDDVREGERQIEELCQQYESLAISKSFASYIYSTIELLKHRYDARKKAAAPGEELHRLEELIEKMNAKYKVVRKTSNMFQKALCWIMP
jgi:hypothetical protein